MVIDVEDFEMSGEQGRFETELLKGGAHHSLYGFSLLLLNTNAR